MVKYSYSCTELHQFPLIFVCFLTLWLSPDSPLCSPEDFILQRQKFFSSGFLELGPKKKEVKSKAIGKF